jgi:hypothetical protein
MSKTASKEVAAVAATDAATDATVATVAAVAATATVTAVAATDEVDDAASPRLTTLLGLHITQSRTKSHLQYNLNNATRDLISAAKAGGDAAAESAASSNIIRMGRDAPVGVAAALSYGIEELIMHAFEVARGKNLKTARKSHLYKGFVEDIDTFAMWNTLPSYIAYKEQLEQDDDEEDDAAPEDVVAAEDEVEKVTTTTFYKYFGDAVNAVKAKDGGTYKDMRVQKEFRDFGSDLVAEAVKRIADTAKVLVHDVVNVRTLYHSHIRAAIKLILIAGGARETARDRVLSFIDEKNVIYKEFITSEGARRESSKSVEDKATDEEKKKTTEHARMKRAYERETEKARISIDKSKKLKAVAKAAGITV